MNGDNIISLINNDKYKPSDVRLEEIVVKSGKKRLISKYTCTDRVVLDILKRKLVPIFEDKFSEYSFAYRENKGTYEAAKYAASLIEKGNKFVVEIDVKDFFENINLQRLESFIAKSVNDTSVIRLIHEYLYVYTVVDGRRQRKTIGIIQGSPLSPLFSNIYMMEFDKYLEDKFLGSSFLDYINSKGLNVNIFDKYGNFTGSFHSEHHYKRSSTLLKQASVYNEAKKRHEICIKIETASLHNQRENLRYFYKHNKKESLKKAIEYMSDSINEMKKSVSINQLLTIEARAKQKYLQSFDDMIENKEFIFEKRTRRPPMNEVNALISFGNTFLYRRIANEIYKTALDIRIGLVHLANSRSESLNLDIAEIFKPIIVDRAIFTVIHNLQINKKLHFEVEDNGGVYLNNNGKRIFIKELEKKLGSKISIDGQKISYEHIIKNEIYKIVQFIQEGEKYRPFKYT